MFSFKEPKWEVREKADAGTPSNGGKAQQVSDQLMGSKL